jgi:chemotaxis protein histidine kinase CheA
MAKNDDGFNLDDMMEIFGDNAELPAKKEEAPSRPAVAIQEAPKEAPKDEISDDEAAILAAYEKTKKEKAARDEEAKRKKDEAAQKILDQYERQLAEAKEREDKLRKELEARQKLELEALTKKDEFKVDEAKKAEEERKIIEEFERQAREQKEKDEAAKKAGEEKAQQELKALAEKQKAEELSRQADESRRDEEFKAKAAAQVGDKKENRLMELLAKAQADLEKAAVPVPAADAAGAAPSAAGRSSLKDAMIDIESAENDKFMLMLDETRKSMFTFLAPMIGIKAATNMLNKTVEKVRSVSPVLFKDANWKMDGSLREDGSVDPERMLANVQKIGIATRVDDFVGGLHSLVLMRVKSVEAGLGAKAATDMKMKLADLRRVFSDKGVKPEWIDIFYSHVIS